MSPHKLLAALMLALCACKSAPTEPYVPPQEESVKPGINDSFLDPALDVNRYEERFEGESREVFVNRAAIVSAMGLAEGSVVADVGAGTGAFLAPLAKAVGSTGQVLALDIAPDFVEHLAARASRERLDQVRAQLCSENSVDLPAASIDAAFICDVYHHFEYPRSSMGSLHYALKPGGEVIIVDFERIPGVSREWILGHVRAGKEVVFAELDEYGFDLVEEIRIDGLVENWMARFRKR